MIIDKVILLLSVATCCFGAAIGQSSTSNYVKVYKAQAPITGSLSTVNDKNLVTESIVYYDGLGREVQSISKEGSRLGKDIISFSTYDGYGRKTISYLPYVANQTTGAYVVNPPADQSSFYVSLFGTIDGQAALSKTIIERSDLGRVLEQGAPGVDWQPGAGHTVEKQYLTNADNEVLRFGYDKNAGVLFSGQYYTRNTLTCTKTIDEHENDVLEFVDKEGRTICKKVKAPNNEYAWTYYVYDYFGNLVVVIPPEGVRRINTN